VVKSRQVPLSQIRGFGPQIEERLGKEGISDVNSLASAEPVRLVRNTSFDMRQTLMWIDEAILMVTCRGVGRRSKMPVSPAQSTSPGIWQKPTIRQQAASLIRCRKNCRLAALGKVTPADFVFAFNVSPTIHRCSTSGRSIITSPSSQEVKQRLPNTRAQCCRWCA